MLFDGNAMAAFLDTFVTQLNVKFTNEGGGGVEHLPYAVGLVLEVLNQIKEKKHFQLHAPKCNGSFSSSGIQVDWKVTEVLNIKYYTVTCDNSDNEKLLITELQRYRYN